MPCWLCLAITRRVGCRLSHISYDWLRGIVALLLSQPMQPKFCMIHRFMREQQLTTSRCSTALSYVDIAREYNAASACYATSKSYRSTSNTSFDQQKAIYRGASRGLIFQTSPGRKEHWGRHVDRVSACGRRFRSDTECALARQCAFGICGW